MYTISINGVLKHIAYNKGSINLYNVEEYLGNPSTAARVKNVQIKSLSPGKKITYTNMSYKINHLET